jgi:hypothetical protein
MSGLYRITPRSGLFGQYYSLNREHTKVTDQDIIFEDDTIPTGTSAGYYFNTGVVSIGYMFTLLEKRKLFFGMYFNAYILKLKVGVNSARLDIKEEVKFFAPLPDIGILFSYRITHWLDLDLTTGMFYLKVGEFVGWLHNFNGIFVFRPTKWLGLSIGYQAFNVHVVVLDDNYNATISYGFRGPTIGAVFKF